MIQRWKSNWKSLSNENQTMQFQIFCENAIELKYRDKRINVQEYS
jgi:hypothetical protein